MSDSTVEPGDLVELIEEPVSAADGESPTAFA